MSFLFCFYNLLYFAVTVDYCFEPFSRENLTNFIIFSHNSVTSLFVTKMSLNFILNVFYLRRKPT